ncbi:hypothetical protein BT96DRAFT_771873, partial [Gymnopus androsaceus JB14]
LPCDIATRWNFTYNMLTAFLEMKEIVHKFLDSSSNALTNYMLMESEWDAVKDLVHVLKDATEFFSSNSPNISAVIPAMDKLDENFAIGILDDQVLSVPLQHAVSIGEKTMNKYYELSDSSDIYRVSM